MILPVSCLLSLVYEFEVIWKGKEIPRKGVRGEERNAETQEEPARGGACYWAVTCGHLSRSSYGAKEPHAVSPGDFPTTEVDPGCYLCTSRPRWVPNEGASEARTLG